MALIACPECGHKVSDTAQTCPSCGLGLAELPPNGDRDLQPEHRQRQTELELALARIDLAWERERPKYLVNQGRFGGSQVVPTKAVALWGGTLVPGMFLAAGGIATWWYFPPGLLGVFYIFAVAVLLVGVLPVTVWFHWKAVEYERAEAEYRLRREAVKAKHESKDESQPDESSPLSG